MNRAPVPFISFLAIAICLSERAAAQWRFPVNRPAPAPDDLVYFSSDQRDGQVAGVGPIFVDEDAFGANNGTSWANAYNEIYDAMADPQVPMGAELWVAEGTYLVASTPLRSQSLTLVNNVAIYGGFAGTETLLSQRSVFGNITILTADINGDDGPGFFVNTGDNCYHVVVGSGVNSMARLDGFEIRGGRADGGGDLSNGAGMFIVGGSPTIANCFFQGNQASGLGGGIYMRASSAPDLTDTVVDTNRAATGAGIYLDGSSPTLIDVNITNNATTAGSGGGIYMTNLSSPEIQAPQIAGNVAIVNGGGMFITNSSPVIQQPTQIFLNTAGPSGGGVYVTASASPDFVKTDFFENTADDGAAMYITASSADLVSCHFMTNAADFNGGGVLILNSTLRFQNCRFVGNSAGADGGALHTSGASSSVTLHGCTLSANSAVSEAGGSYREAEPTLTFRNCILWRNRDASGIDFGAQFNAGIASNTIIQGLGAPSGSNFDADPMFVDPDGADGIEGTGDDNLRLQYGSPAIDAGSNSDIHPDFGDLDQDLNVGEPTPFDIRDTGMLIARRKEDPDTTDSGVGSPPFVDIGAYEYFPDCNENSIPDDQEAPSQCATFTGLCSTPGQEDFWTCFNNWDIPGSFYPDSDGTGSPGGSPNRFVKIPAGADVFLNEDVAVPKIHVQSGATLRVTQGPGDQGDLSFVDPGYFRVDGTLLVGDNRVIGDPNALVGSTNPVPWIVGPEGVYSADPAPYPLGVSAVMHAFDAFIEPGGCEPLCKGGGSVLLSDLMRLYVSNDLHVIGSDPVSCACPVAGGINPPPKLAAGGSSQILIGGNMVLTGSVESVLSGNAVITVAGSVNNESIAPELYDWSLGTVLMVAGTEPRVFEVAGDDLGASNTGFFNGTDTNFSIGRLDIHTGANVIFENRFPNVAGDDACEEALYVDTLVFQPGAIVQIDDCKVYYHTLIPNGVSHNVSGCGALVAVGDSAVGAPLAGENTCFDGTNNLGTVCSTDGDCSKTYGRSPSRSIPDGAGPGQPAIDTINVTNAFTVTDVNVRLDIEHTWVGDLIVAIEHNGRSVMIVDRTGVPPSINGCNSNDYHIVLDDEGAGGPVESLCGQNTGAPTPASPPNYQPVQLLSAFDGMSALGAWRITVSDNDAQDIGVLTDWSLTFNNGLVGACSLNSRYLEFLRSTSAASKTVKVTVASMPLSPAYEGEEWWAGTFHSLPNAPSAALTGAELQCSPLAQTLPSGTLYLYGAAIVPDATYELRICDANGRFCSDPLAVSTATWGDVGPSYGGGSQPNFADLSLIVDKFIGLDSAPDIASTDLVGTASAPNPNVPNHVANFADISSDVKAFRSESYSYGVPSCP